MKNINNKHEFSFNFLARECKEMESDYKGIGQSLWTSDKSDYREYIRSHFRAWQILTVLARYAGYGFDVVPWMEDYENQLREKREHAIFDHVEFCVLSALIPWIREIREEIE